MVVMLFVTSTVTQDPSSNGIVKVVNPPEGLKVRESPSQVIVEFEEDVAKALRSMSQKRAHSIPESAA